jgi:hypothetical protein
MSRGHHRAITAQDVHADGGQPGRRHAQVEATMSQPHKPQEPAPDAPDTSTELNEEPASSEPFLAGNQTLSPSTTTHPSIKNN